MLSAINYYKYSIQLIQLIFNCNKHTGQKVCLDEIQVNKINKYKSNGLVDIKTRYSQLLQLHLNAIKRALNSKKCCCLFT